MATLQIFLIALLIGLASFSAPTGNQTPAATKPVLTSDYVWTKLLDTVAWRRSYNFQMFSHHDTLWVFHPDGNWFSPDGKSWQKSPLPNAISNVALLDYVQFKGAVYGLGHLEGNIEHYKFTPAIYRTTDFQSWQTLTTESNLPRRFYNHPFVFNDQLWIIGGEDSHGQYSDIWSSPDGVTWTRQKDNMPFKQRSNSQVVHLNGKLFLLNNDVWTSSDGLNWQKLTDEIVKNEEIFGYSALVYDQKIWLLGCNRNGQYSSQVLVSADGQHWEEQQASWSARGGVAATVHQGKVYLTGGKNGGIAKRPELAYSNDMWTLEKK